jgi:small subunit ribosomal protein S18
MAKKKDNKRRRKVEIEIAPRNCPFCKTDTEPDYKEYSVLAKYLTDRAKMFGKSRTGLCAKHQRRVSIAVKRARHLALLPYTPSLK